MIGQTDVILYSKLNRAKSKSRGDLEITWRIENHVVIVRRLKSHVIAITYRNQSRGDCCKSRGRKCKSRGDFTKSRGKLQNHVVNHVVILRNHVVIWQSRGDFGQSRGKITSK